MASEIISSTVDENYPIAGVDNDTQGFRDNFNIIKTGLSRASTEITTLQASTAKLDATNDFNGTLITDATLDANTESFLSSGGIVSSQEISFTNGMYQSFRFAAATENTTLNLTLSGFPSSGDRVAKFRCQFFGPGGTDPVTVLFAALGGATIYKSPNWPAQFLVDSATNPIIVDFWSYDGGNSYVFAEYIGRFEP